ncbi:sigma-70 family RNA polymerase sigma factor [Planctomycetaceae bacterium SH139]
MQNNDGAARLLGAFESGTSLTLLNLVVAKDQEAWQNLTQLYGPLVGYWCRKAHVPIDDRDDIVQEVFRSVFTGIPNFSKSPTEGTFRGWLWTISRNKIRDYFKVRVNKAIATGGTDAHLNIQQVPEFEPLDAESSLHEENNLTRQALKIIRSEVKQHTFDAFWRSTIDGISPDVVAVDLGISVDSVYQAKARMLKRLRELLE